MPGWISTATRRAASVSRRGRRRPRAVRRPERHGVDLRIAGADERDGLARAGEFERMADAGLLVAEREAVLLLAELQIGDEIEIEPVADPVGRLASSAATDGAVRLRRCRRGRRRRRAAGRAGGRAGSGSIGSVARPMAQVARRDLRLGTTRVPAFSAAASATQGVPVSASTIGGRIDQAIAFLIELGDGEEAQRHTEMGRSSVERRFVGLDLDGRERRKRLRREVLAGEASRRPAR